MAEAVVAVALLLVEQVIKLLDERQNSVRHDVRKAQTYLRRMEAYLKSEAEKDEGNEGLQARVIGIRDVAYSIEDALDEYFLRVPNHSHTYMITRLAHRVVHAFPDRRAISKLASRIAGIEKQIDLDLKVDRILHPEEGCSGKTWPGNNDSAPCYPEEDETVGFEKAEEQLFKQLMERNSSRLAISIVGPFGSGKTTLVKNVYKRMKVHGFFDRHAWINVSGPFVANKLLLRMLRKLDPERNMQEPILQEDTNYLKESLQLALGDKRFVIVLDNIGNKGNLESIASVLPNGLSGSKIISTSRNSDVVSNSVSSKYYTHDLSPGIPWKNAWYLFCKKAFQNSEGNCPEDLEKWAQKILKRCENLPLAISAVGTALANKPQTTLEWKNFHDSLGSDVPIIISRSWELSYKDLSSNLKTCFLYFSMFPEDYSISRERLIRLWVAEGFVKPHRTKTIELVAEGYLNELVERNLVVVTAREIDGRRVKLCRVLNLVREFIIPKAKHFITVFEANSADSILYDTPGKEIRRLSVQCNIDLLSTTDLSHLRTLLVFGDFDGKTTVTSSELQKVLKACNLLKVLDLQGASSLENLPKFVESLHLLRYLNLSQTQIKTIPRSIKTLGFLETLDLKQTKVTYLPPKMDELHNLRHLLVYRYDLKNYVTFEAVQGVTVSECNIGALTRIQKLSLIKVNSKIIDALGELKGLKKLGLIDLKREDGGKLCLAVQKMQDLSTFDVRSTNEDEILDLDHMKSPPPHLQHLYMKGRLEGVPKWVPQLHSLVKVGLKWSKLKAEANSLEALEALQELPQLLELELASYYAGTELTFKAATFKKLMILSLDKFDELIFMKVESRAMPMLEKLTMSRCQKLKLLPVFVPEYLKSLKEVRLYDMCTEFIANFERDGEGREAFQHVGIIKSFSSLGRTHAYFTGYKNLSPLQWHVPS